MYKTYLFSPRRFLSGYRNGRSIKRERERDLFRAIVHPYGDCGQDFIWGGGWRAVEEWHFLSLQRTFFFPSFSESRRGSNNLYRSLSSPLHDVRVKLHLFFSLMSQSLHLDFLTMIVSFSMMWWSWSALYSAMVDFSSVHSHVWL